MASGADKTQAVLLTPAEMGEADRLTIARGIPGIDLMERAGEAVACAAQAMVPDKGAVLVLCGPGNNGGDGFVAARLLASAGHRVALTLLKDPAGLTGDARSAFERMGADLCTRSLLALSEGGAPGEAGAAVEGDLVARACHASLKSVDLVIDALFGAGLDRPLAGPVRALAEAVNAAGKPVLAVDLPSGLHGQTGAILGEAVKACATVTFFRKKPGHVLFPGRRLCGTVEVAQIGIQPDVLDQIAPDQFENGPELWGAAWPQPAEEGHKYQKGHAVVFGGPMASTGAARLAAGAALRAGAGLVSLASPPGAMMVNACHLTAIMLKKVAGVDGIRDLLADRRLNAVLIGPGYGVGPDTCAAVHALLTAGRACVLDADALTSFEAAPEDLFCQIKATAASVLLTPHEGEFARLFPDLGASCHGGSKLERARLAADRSGACVVLKGPDTVIAAPDGRAAINTNAPPFLATAGSGDVLAGLATGLLAQDVPGFEAACQAVWLHGEAGREAGPGLIAEDLAEALRSVVRALVRALVDKDAGAGC